MTKRRKLTGDRNVEVQSAPVQRRMTPMEATRAQADRLGIVLANSQRVVVEDDIAEGARKTVKRARVADPLNRLAIPDDCKRAAQVYRQAYEHMLAGRGLGPMPWGRDQPSHVGAGDSMPAQLRSLSAAEWYRRGVQALGLAAAEGVVNWVVINGLPLTPYDALRKWRKGRGANELEKALERLRDEYFPPVRGTAQQPLDCGG